MEKHHRTSNNGGFLFGLIVGVIVTLLFTTKKGRKILRMLTEEGVGKLEEWQEIVKDVVSEQERQSQEGDDYTAAAEFVKEAHEETETGKNQHVEEKKETVEEKNEPVTHAEYSHSNTSEHGTDVHNGSSMKVKPQTRRFFRGIPKKN